MSRSCDVTFMATSVRSLVPNLTHFQGFASLDYRTSTLAQWRLEAQGKAIKNFETSKGKIKENIFQYILLYRNVLCLVSGCRTLTLECSNGQRLTWASVMQVSMTQQALE